MGSIIFLMASKKCVFKRPEWPGAMLWRFFTTEIH